MLIGEKMNRSDLALRISAILETPADAPANAMSSQADEREIGCASVAVLFADRGLWTEALAKVREASAHAANTERRGLWIALASEVDQRCL
jgi:hypothetical protein